MQTFIDTATQKVWAFDDDVKVTETSGQYSFETVLGAPIVTPTTLTPYTVPEPTAAQVSATAWSAYQAKAMAALVRSDNTIARAAEAVTLGHNTATSADMVAYVTWRRALRAIVSAPTGDPTQPLPTEPPYPAGT